MMEDVLKIISTPSDETCDFCNSNIINEVEYGPLYKRKNFIAHHFCVLFSTIQQKGRDKDGIQGFLLNDIADGLKKLKNVICYYCGKPHASISCSFKSCPVSFHYPCGLKNGSLHQFWKQYKSFCIQHRPAQVGMPKIKGTTLCMICLDPCERSKVLDIIWAPCCMKTWYHKHCLKVFAHSAGYYFKCAVCNDNKIFNTTVRQHGIYIPLRDASWEQDENAYSELTQDENPTCNAETCACGRGRTFSNNGQKWKIVPCNSCNRLRTHIWCNNLNPRNPRWKCSICVTVDMNLNSKRTENNFKKKRAKSDVPGEVRNRPSSSCLNHTSGEGREEGSYKRKRKKKLKNICKPAKKRRTLSKNDVEEVAANVDAEKVYAAKSFASDTEMNALNSLNTVDADITSSHSKASEEEEEVRRDSQTTKGMAGDERLEGTCSPRCTSSDPGPSESRPPAKETDCESDYIVEVYSRLRGRVCVISDDDEEEGDSAPSDTDVEIIMERKTEGSVAGGEDERPSSSGRNAATRKKNCTNLKSSQRGSPSCSRSNSSRSDIRFFLTQKSSLKNGEAKKETTGDVESSEKDSVRCRLGGECPTPPTATRNVQKRQKERPSPFGVNHSMQCLPIRRRKSTESQAVERAANSSAATERPAMGRSPPGKSSPRTESAIHKKGCGKKNGLVSRKSSSSGNNNLLDENGRKGTCDKGDGGEISWNEVSKILFTSFAISDSSDDELEILEVVSGKSSLCGSRESSSSEEFIEVEGELIDIEN